MQEETRTTEESNFVRWAREEVKRAGLLDPDSDYDGMLGEEVLKLVETFDGAGHSGCSAGLTASIFARLAEWKPLSPITDGPSEWMKVCGPDSQFPDQEDCWQNRRASSCFSLDAGATYYDIDAPMARWRRYAWRITRRLGSGRRWEKTHRTDPA
jgi:hypothetical protein